MLHTLWIYNYESNISTSYRHLITTLHRFCKVYNIRTLLYEYKYGIQTAPPPIAKLDSIERLSVA